MMRAQKDATFARALWDSFAPTVFRLLHRTLGPEQPVDEAVHQVLLRVFDAAPQGTDDAAVRSIVISAVARVARDHLRWNRFRRRSRPRSASGLLTLYRALAHLRARDQVAFAFHFIDGMDAGEVAGALCESPRRTNQRLARAWDVVAAQVRVSDRSPLASVS